MTGPHRRRLVRPVAAAAVLLAAGLLCFLSLREHEAPHPAPARAIVLVFGPTPTGTARMPALLRMRARGRGFDRVFAPDPAAVGSREAALRGRLPSSGATDLPMVTDAVAGRGFAIATFGAALPEIRTGGATVSVAEVSAVADFLRLNASNRFLSIVGLTPSLPEEGWRPATEGTAAELPSIATSDLRFDARPGGRGHPDGWSQASQRRAEVRHMDACQRADGELAVLLDALEQWAPDAAIVYVGDPVPDLGTHGLLERRDALFDETLRSLVVAQVPGIPPRERSFNEVASPLGVARLLTDLADVPALAGSDPSLLPRLLGHSPSGEQEALSSTPRQAARIGRSLRTSSFRYTEWPDGSLELFDHRTDPGERANLAHAPALSGALADLRSRLERAGALVEPPRPATPSRARRVVLVIIDDLNTEVGAWGAPVRTPAIDSLASRGVRFSRAYATVAACSPSRSAFLLGQRPETTGIWDNHAVARPAGVEIAPVEEVFAAHGFRTASIGKVFHDPEPFRWDIRDVAAPDMREEHPEETEVDRAASTSLAEPVDTDDLALPDGRRAQRAAQLLTDHRTERLFLSVGIVRPHRRWIAPRADFDLYPAAQVLLPPEPPNSAASIPAIAIKTKAQPFPGVSLLGREPPGMVGDPSVRREAVAAYRACVTFADRQVGRVLDTLDRLDLWRDSIVVLVGDNGYHLGDHGGLFRKDTLYEEALHVPLIIAAPGLEAGRVVEEPVELLGLYRTLLDLGGIASDQATAGRSLTPRLTNSPLVEGPGALSYRRVRPPERGWSIRTSRIRYTLWPDGSEELYDTASDPRQKTNLVDTPDYARSKARLRARLMTRVDADHPEH